LPAGPVRLILRPEDVFMTGAREPGDGLPGRIVRRSYLGGRTQYAVALATGECLAIDLFGDAHDRFALGDAVTLLLDPARTLAIAP
jgi:hypothetical protein